ncbi:conserved hypothetical protein [metagenome]|uniref:Uncharacterized protein n=1 Tax=metagenome TaxID=256318 RepID=A0A2P2BXM4_9ZZZZ
MLRGTAERAGRCRSRTPSRHQTRALATALPHATYPGDVGKFVIVLLVIAAVVYVLVRVIERRGISRRPGPGRARPSPPPRGPIGPDDDPDFLWGLNKKRRHPEDDPPPTP